MKRRIAPIIVVTASLLAVIALLAIMKNTTRAGAITENFAPWILDSSSEPAGPTTTGFSVEPSRQGSFVSAGASVDFAFTVKNTDDTVADVFEIEIITVWPAQLYQSSGTTPLNDSNNDGKIDTATLAPGEKIDLIARISAPLAASIGDDNRTVLIITSSNDPSVEESVLFQSAVPSAFLQSFRDEGLTNPGIFLAQANYQQSQEISSPGGHGSEIAVSETISGYIYIWSHQHLLGNFYVTDIYSLMVDKEGQLTSALTQITDHSNALLPTHDVNPVVAVDSHGNIGVSWQRLQIDQDLKVNNNIFFRVLNQEGVPVGVETNLTNNIQWGFQETLGPPEYNSPRIAPMADSGFFAAWQREQQDDEGAIQDIIFATLDSSGDLVISPTNLTNDSPGGNGNVAPALAGLSTNRTLVSWVRRATDNDDVLFLVVDAQGDIVHGPEDISEDERVTDWWNFDAVELSNGSILLAWQAWGCIEGEYTGRIRFAVLNDNYRRIRKPSCMGPDGVAVGGDRGVSVTADANNNGIITWTDQDPSNRRNLYYSLINDRGNIVTEPLAFYHSDAPGGLISLNTAGYANTSRSFIDGVAYFSDPRFLVQKGHFARITIRYGNIGTLSSGGMTVTAILNTNLVYESDTAPIDPTVNGNTITWDFSNYNPVAGVSQFDLYSTLPATATVGASYPITVAVDLEFAESNPENNNDLAHVIVSQPFFLPLVAN